MSDQPPPAFGGHPNYAQQWPPPYPPIMPSGFRANTEYLPAASLPPLNPTQHMDANLASFYANSHLSGAANHPQPGHFFPPPPPPLPYMNHFDPSQLTASPFPPMPIQSLGYPPMPAPPGSSIPPAPADARVADVNPSGTARQPKSKLALLDGSREEGEISEEENDVPVLSKKKPRDLNRAKRRRTSNQHSDLEEGETMSSASVSSSRSSSPYNPSLPLAADPEVVSHAIEIQKRETTATSSKETRGPVSTEQLRLRAQGALLSLKPHNISYDELVGEGLNPTILRQLYEQVGLKITSQPEKPLDIENHQSNSPSRQTVSAAPKKIDRSRRKSSTAPPAPMPSGPSVSQSETGKPIERKELIARMLAAKAAKASTVTAKSTPEKPQASSTPPSSAPSGESQVKPNVVPVREKNKAQTELARQRIEELKRQALLKKQQKSQLGQPSQDSQGDQPASIPNPAEPSTLAAPVVQHPLPVRPPVPQASEVATIPGLVMASSKIDSGLQTPTDAPEVIHVDSTPVSRAAHRKRPRASDFDEPDPTSKRHSGYEKDLVDPTDRLVIEFSDDDESLYGEDPDAMDMDSDQAQQEQSSSMVTLDVSRPVLQKYPSSASTPQGSSWQSDNENMRQKNLAIQEMHRRIAELEERRKAKLAGGRTESPRTVDDSGASLSSSSALSPALQSGPADADDTGSLPASTTKSAVDTGTTTTSLPSGSSFIDSLGKSSVEALASMDLAQLDSLRSAIRHLEGNEPGLPGLNAGTSSAQTDIASCKEYVTNVSSGITNNKEDYDQILGGLKKLGHEIGDLSLEFLDGLRRQAKIKQEHFVEETVSATSQASPDDDQLICDASAPKTVPQIAQESEVDVPMPNPTELSISSPSESAGSAMDESADISSSSQDSSSKEESAAPVEQETLDSLAQSEKEDSTSIPDNIGSAEYESSDSLDSDQSSSEQDSPVSPGQPNSDHYIPGSSSPMVNGGNATVDNPVNLDSHSERFHREPSAESGSDESEAYEPPEPDSAAEPNSPYSPPFSPAPHVPVEGEGNTPVTLDALTVAPQMAVSEVHPSPQVGTLGNQPSSTSAISGSKFTPYISPLRHFKAYRYHPGFTKDVSDGYRSLTYSHDIDAMKDFCPFELAGGVCNDRSCEFQHFRDITLSDDKILIEMGSVREGQTEEEKETYLAGLKEIINEMRRDKVKEFSTVASEIVAYRRRFLQDPSRVLPL